MISTARFVTLQQKSTRAVQGGGLLNLSPAIFCSPYLQEVRVSLQQQKSSLVKRQIRVQ